MSKTRNGTYEHGNELIDSLTGVLEIDETFGDLCKDFGMTSNFITYQKAFSAVDVYVAYEFNYLSPFKGYENYKTSGE